MKILIIGSGGREHALGWKLKQSPQVKKIYFVPGNPGTKEIGENIPNIEATDIKRLLKFAKDKKIDLTVVGPETVLVLGIADVFSPEFGSRCCAGYNQSLCADHSSVSKAFALNS